MGMKEGYIFGEGKIVLSYAGLGLLVMILKKVGE